MRSVAPGGFLRRALSHPRRAVACAGPRADPHPLYTRAVRTIVLTRHGLTTRSHPEQHLGQRIDVPLSDDGHAQAAALAERLEPVALARIISSPLRRARETAAVVAARCRTAASGERYETDARLLEMDYGAWEGLTYAQIDERDGDARRRWAEDPAAMACPGGESGNDVAARVRDLLQELLAAPPAAGPILLVGHSTTNRILVCAALGIPIREYRRRIVQGQVNLTALAWDDGAAVEQGRAVLVNDLGHVRRPPAAPWE